MLGHLHAVGGQNALPQCRAFAVDRDPTFFNELVGFAARGIAPAEPGIARAATEAAGTAEGRPFRWMHHVLADGAGRRVAVTCMVEQPMASRFATADRDLVDGLLVAPGEGGGGAAEGPKSPPDDRAARVPAKSRMP